MSFSLPLTSAFNDTKNRSNILSPQSGMCSFCTEDCVGTCEIGLAAVLGARTVYPTNTGANQIASEKKYPVDFSHFNINGRVFGAEGVAPLSDQATVFNVRLEREFGVQHPVTLTMPIILPALIKMNWQDYFSGAAMAGVCCMIGENATAKDPHVKMKDGKFVHFPMLRTILDSFQRYDRGYGQIVMQCNSEEDVQGLPEYAIEKHNVAAIEFKFGQGAKGIQPVKQIKTLENALKAQAEGSLVRPDPSEITVQQAYANGICPNFYSYGRNPMWTDDYLISRVQNLRGMGLKNVYFKAAGYDRADLEHILRIACAAQVDMVTFDGAGGGSGYSPCKMMNEWALPTICLEEAVCAISCNLRQKGYKVPAITITGGFSSEDQVFKALAYGNNTVTAVGICRAAMAAAMTGKKAGDLIAADKVPVHLKPFGSKVEELFGDLPDLRALYGKEANGFSPGAIGVFSYLNKIAFGLRHFGALNRKFDVNLFDRSDLVPLTRDAKELIVGKWF